MGLLTTRERSAIPTTVDRLRDEFNRALQNWWNDTTELKELFTGGDWNPSLDISETDEAVEIKVDLPGIKPEDMEIRVTDDRLTIQGERKEEKETKNKTIRRVERSYGSFYRSIALPAGAKADDVSAVSDNGVITITVPKGDAAKAKKIKVKPKPK